MKQVRNQSNKAIILIVFPLLVCVQAMEKGDNNNEEQVKQTVETKGIYEGNSSAETFQAILRQLQIKSDECYLPLVVEEILRSNSSLSIWVVPTIISMDAAEQYSFSLACYVLLADRQTGEIVSRYYHPHAWESSDVWRLTKISTDDRIWKSCSKYINTYSVTAFFEDSSRVQTAMKADCSLFIQQNISLNKIFHYTTDAYKMDEDYCEESFFFEKNLFISDKTTNGFYDIVMSIGMQIDDDETDYKIFRYTGNTYEETTKPDSVVYANFVSQPGCSGTVYFTIYFCFGKTLAQAYDIWKENTVYESHLKSELPKEDIEYRVADAGCCDDADLLIGYKYGKNKLLIYMSDGHFGTDTKMIEKGEYTQIISILSD